MPSPILPSTQSFPFPGHHADDPDGPGPRGAGNGNDNGGRQPNDLPGHDGHGTGRTDNDGTQETGQGQGQGNGDGDGASGSGNPGRGVNDRGNGNNGNPGSELGGSGAETLPGQSGSPGQPGPGLPGGRTGAGGNLYGNGGGNGYGNGGANAGGGPRTGGSPMPGMGGIQTGIGGLVGQISQAASNITSAVFGTVVSSSPNTLPHLFTEQLPHFVGDSAARTQPASDHSAPPASPPSTNPAQARTASEPVPTTTRNADTPAQIVAGAPANEAEGEARGLIPTPTQMGVDTHAAQMLAQAGTPFAAMETPHETATQLPASLAAGAMEAEALERALAENQNKAVPLRADGKDAAMLLRQAGPTEGESNISQQAAVAKQPTDALDRLLAKMSAETRPMADARAADGRMLDPRVADARLPLADGLTRSTTAEASKAADLAKAASAADGGRTPVAADGRNSTLSSFGRGLFGGTVEYTRQALDWVGQQVREFGFGASPDADGARAMRVVAGLVVASVGVLVVIGVLYALRIIFVA